MGSETLVFLLLAIVYVAGKKYIEIHERRKKPVSDEERLSAMAYQRSCSEFDLFRLAGSQWHKTEKDIQRDFKRYLTEGVLPHYIRDFIRKNKPVEKDSLSGKRGEGLPAGWSA